MRRSWPLQARGVGAAIANPARWRRWWPDLRLQVIEDRADKGIRWTVAGPLAGTMEIWLEPMLDGVILHYFLHAEPSGAGGRGRTSPYASAQGGGQTDVLRDQKRARSRPPRGDGARTLI